jgi:hypothetical protein
MTFFHRQIGDISIPYLTDLDDLEVPQEIGIVLMAGSGLDQRRLGHEGCDPHDFHESTHSFTTDRSAFLAELSK